MREQRLCHGRNAARKVEKYCKHPSLLVVISTMSRHRPIPARKRWAYKNCMLAGVVLLMCALTTALSTRADTPAADGDAGREPLESRFSMPLLGSYRKSMEIEKPIQRACDLYGVPLALARSVCMYE